MKVSPAAMVFKTAEEACLVSCATRLLILKTAAELCLEECENEAQEQITHAIVAQHEDQTKMLEVTVRTLVSALIEGEALSDLMGRLQKVAIPMMMADLGGEDCDLASLEATRDRLLKTMSEPNISVSQKATAERLLEQINRCIAKEKGEES